MSPPVVPQQDDVEELAVERRALARRLGEPRERLDRAVADVGRVDVTQQVAEQRKAVARRELVEVAPRSQKRAQHAQRRRERRVARVGRVGGRAISACELAASRREAAAQRVEQRERVEQAAGGGDGGAQKLKAEAIRVILPTLEGSSRAARNLGIRSLCTYMIPSMNCTLLAAQASVISTRSAWLTAQGFSHITCLPALAALMTHSLRKPVGRGM